MTSDPPTYPKAASLVLVMAVSSACAPTLDQAGEADSTIPIEYPIVLRGEAPAYEREAIEAPGRERARHSAKEARVAWADA